MDGRDQLRDVADYLRRFPSTSPSRVKRLRHYGLTPEQHDELVRQQGGRCAICRRPPKKLPLAIDHEHVPGAKKHRSKTGGLGRVRGLLCFTCNRFLVMGRATSTALRRAADYLDSDFDGRSIRPRKVHP